MNPKQHHFNIRDMFDRTAPRYVERIDPAFAPLAAELVAFAFAQIPNCASLLDLGTGSGLAALAASTNAQHILGLDYSQPLLEKAQAKLPDLNLSHIHFVRGDMHALCLPDSHYDVVLGSFSFNSTDPAIVFPEALRVLKPGGTFAMQEWSSSDLLSEIVYDATAEYSVDDAPPALAAMRELMSEPDAWDDLESIEDIAEALRKAGFQGIETQSDISIIRFDSINAFLNYKLAWASRHDEIEAMPLDVRSLFYSELHDRLEPHLERDGSLIWQPATFRLRATKVTT